ncbi:exodeoxyribonuclease III [Sulfuriferula nivalis]|uniref:Exodeoxyribonuclease III n=1 Tax=Sulfuriferula nivalis TaxID=2675298 RepID=A0A809SFY3_9PROT|nr:exodeoxyribonuclease III [Sulfuriferula nivalis]
MVCLQETKTENVNFPTAAITDAGYKVIYSGQKTYNGVAILSRYELDDVVVGIPGWEDAQQRVISATVEGVRVICVYVPNGQALDSDKYTYKLAWLKALQDYVSQQLLSYPKLAILGDYNIAPADEDVYDPQGWGDGILVSPAERDAFLKLLDLGLVDSFRLFNQPDKSYTWWDYRMAAFRRNMGARIDHILLSDGLAKRCVSCEVDVAPRKLERPSDHAPIIVTIGGE